MLLISIVVSIVLMLIAIWVFRSEIGTPERLLIWYSILASLILLIVAVMCMVTEPMEPVFYSCIKKIAHGWTLLAAHALVLFLYLDNKDRDNIPLSVRANTLGRLLILGAALLFVLSEYHWIVLPAIAVVTMPLMTTIYKCDQKKKQNNQIT